MEDIKNNIIKDYINHSENIVTNINQENKFFIATDKNIYYGSTDFNDNITEIIIEDLNNIKSIEHKQNITNETKNGGCVVLFISLILIINSFIIGSLKQDMKSLFILLTLGVLLIIIGATMLAPKEKKETLLIINLEKDKLCFNTSLITQEEIKKIINETLKAKYDFNESIKRN